MAQPVIARSNDVIGGTPVFHGTRVPVQTLLDYLEAGETIDDFLEGFRRSDTSRSSRSLRKRRAR